MKKGPIIYLFFNGRSLFSKSYKYIFFLYIFFLKPPKNKRSKGAQDFIRLRKLVRKAIQRQRKDSVTQVCNE